jgi:hypothetical protein
MAAGPRSLSGSRSRAARNMANSDGEATAINLNIEPGEKPGSVAGIEPIHRG